MKKLFEDADSHTLSMNKNFQNKMQWAFNNRNIFEWTNSKLCRISSGD